MYLIKDRLGRCLRINIDNKIKFVNNETLAEVFPSEREADDFIRKTYKKKTRKNYRIVKCDNDFVPELKTYQSSNDKEVDNKFVKSIQAFDEIVNTYLNPEIEKYSKELSRYDKQIQDIRHFIRDENTKLNACQGYQVFIKIQELERKRVGVKKELQRYAYLRARVNKAVRYFEDFEYEEYKNREIEDVRAFLFGS